MEKKKQPSAFAYAAARLSKAQLLATAKMYEKPVPPARRSKEQLPGLLEGVLSAKQQLEALSTFMLAGRHSMHLFNAPSLKGAANLTVDFKIATAKPQVIHCGPVSEIAAGQQLILWAMLDGTSTILDEYLEIKTTPESVVLVSFYDPASKVLQVRAGMSAAEKIKREFAALLNLKPETDIGRLYIKNRQEMYELGKLLNANVFKAKGRKKKPKGFDVVYGENEDCDDVRQSSDYTDHVAATDPIQEDLKFTFDGHDIKLGIGFDSRSVVFRTGASEVVVQFVYGCLKQHFKV